MFRTYEPTRDRLVAVKVFRLDVIPEQAQALADELARAAEAGLFHPSIVEPIAAGVEGTVAYRAEEYVAAESLDVAMRHYAPAALDKALPFITQLAGAIDFARAAGVGHGALHPRDIFVTPDEARASGFGVVEALERVGLRAPVRRPYSPPERIAGGAWSTPADVFSLAAIAYELLTAKRPSGTGEDIGSLDESHAGANAGALHAVLARAMADEPTRRFPTALAFAAALEAAARGGRSTDAVRDVAAIAAPSRGAGGSGGSEVPLGSDVLARSAVLSNVASRRIDREPARTVDPVAPPPAERSEPREPRRAREPKRAPEPDRRERTPEPERTPEQHRIPEPERIPESERTPEPKGTPGPPEPLETPAAPKTLLFDDIASAAPPERFADEFTSSEETRRMRDDAPDLLALDDEIRDEAPSAVEVAAARDPRAMAPVEEEIRELPSARGVADRDAGAPAMFGAAVAEERPRLAVLPFAITAIVSLLIGFAAGYVVGGRDRSVPNEPQRATAGSQPGAPQGRAWSDQQVTQQPPATPPSSSRPPSVPPPIPADSAAASPRESAPAAPGVKKPALTSRPAAPAATRGTLVVQSTPAGASVTINGRWRGRTPLTLANLQFGPYTVRVVQPGYAIAREEFSLSAGEPQRTMSVRLQRSSAPPQPEVSSTPPPPQAGLGVGTIYVDSRPRGARVFVDGKAVGVTPLRLGDVQAGSHTVRLELTDHLTWTATKNVVAGQETTFTGSLERIR